MQDIQLLQGQKRKIWDNFKEGQANRSMGSQQEGYPQQIPSKDNTIQWTRNVIMISLFSSVKSWVDQQFVVVGRSGLMLVVVEVGMHFLCRVGWLFTREPLRAAIPVASSHG